VTIAVALPPNWGGPSRHYVGCGPWSYWTSWHVSD